MSRYSDVAEWLTTRRVISRLYPVEEKVLVSLRAEFPTIPQAYLDLLREFGSGTFGEMGYRVYGGLVDPDEIYDPETAEKLKSLMLFGDDYASDTDAFDLANDWEVVHVLPYGEVMRTGLHFEAFFRKHIVEVFPSG
jgi:hypothetical protein